MYINKIIIFQIFSSNNVRNAIRNEKTVNPEKIVRF